MQPEDPSMQEEQVASPTAPVAPMQQEPAKQEQPAPEGQQEDRLKGTILETTPQNQQKREAYNSGILRLMYDKKTKKSIYDILQSGEPTATIPKAANLVNKQVTMAVRAKGKDVDLGTRINGMIFTSMELGNLGTAAGFFQLTKDDMQPIVQESLQQFVHSGLKSKSIDPIEIQQVAESLMTPEQREMGLAEARKRGLPEKPGVRAAMEMYAGKQVDKEKEAYMNKAAAQQRQQVVQQAAPQQQQPQPSAIGGAMA